MQEILSAWSPTNWFLAAIAAFIIGLSKAGIKGIDMLNVTLMALVFGAKSSTGVVLPLLCLGDIIAVYYYHRHAEWKHFFKLIPWMAAGILIGVGVGNYLPEGQFKKMMAIIILLAVVIMVMVEFRKIKTVPTNPAFTASMGLMAGFTTMLGNLAGAFANLYFLAMRMPKNEFIGTAAWLFLVINLFKLPFQVVFWKNINATTLKTDLVLAPALLLGFALGLWLVRRISDDNYRKIILVLTLAGAVVIFFR